MAKNPSSRTFSLRSFRISHPQTRAMRSNNYRRIAIVICHYISYLELIIEYLPTSPSYSTRFFFLPFSIYFLAAAVTLADAAVQPQRRVRDNIFEFVRQSNRKSACGGNELHLTELNESDKINDRVWPGVLLISPSLREPPPGAAAPGLPVISTSAMLLACFL